MEVMRLRATEELNAVLRRAAEPAISFARNPAPARMLVTLSTDDGSCANLYTLQNWYPICAFNPATPGMYLTRIETNDHLHYAFMYFDGSGWYHSITFPKQTCAPQFIPKVRIPEDGPAYLSLEFAGLDREYVEAETFKQVVIARRVVRRPPN